MNKKIPLGAAIAFMVVVAGITFCITMMVSLNHFNKMVLNVKEREETYKKLADVDREVRQNFAGTIDEETLNNAISSGYIRGLGDRYSSYLTRDEYEEKLAEQKGERVAIGVLIEKDQTGYMRIKEVLADSPAEEKQLQAGDFLISIDGTDLKNVSLANAERMLKGQAGTKVSIVYRRDGIDTTEELQRKDVDMQYVTYRMIGANGYIKITEFNSRTNIQFKLAVDSLIQQGATGLVFDLRDNNTDSLDAANAMLNMLCPSGDLGIRVNKDGSQEVMATSDQYQVSLPMSVIINGKTGSAAEYFTLCLRDFNKVNVVGTTSLGKSVIQQLIKLTDGSAVNLTVAHFLSPTQTDILGGGIKPDYEVKLTTEQEQNFSSLTDETDPQIKKAVEIVNSKKVE